MPERDVPQLVAFIVSFWLEALVYGFFVCLFAGTLYVNLTLRKNQDGHSKIMFYVSILMFFIATMHVSIDCFRLVTGYINHSSDSGGPANYLNDLASWHHVLKDVLYITQEIVGDSAAIYRIYVVWGRNWKAIVLPFCLLLVSLGSGYTICGLYPSQPANSTIFDPVLEPAIYVFFVISAVQSGITTSLIAFRIWQTDRRAMYYRMSGKGNLMPILRILVESAAIQFVSEFLLLVLWIANSNAQYIILEPGVSLVGISFCAITIRIAFFQSQTLNSSKGGQAQGDISIEGPIGSIPLRPMPISINITKEIEAHADNHSEGAGDMSDSMFDTKRAGPNGAESGIVHVSSRTSSV